MSDSERVHRRDTDSPPPAASGGSGSYNRMHRHSTAGSQGSSPGSQTTSSSTNTSTSGTYVIQVPKEMVYHVPPPGRAKRHQVLTNSHRRRRTCRQCCCATLCLLLVLLALLIAAGGVFYLMYHPVPPSFSVDRVSIHGIDVVTANSTTISPDFNVTITSRNPNGVVGFYYEPGSAVSVYHQDLKLCGGALPAFYQSPKNETVFETVLVGGQIVMSADVKQKLAGEQKNGSVPLRMTVGVPVKVRVSFVRTWKVPVNAACDLLVSNLTSLALVLSKNCTVDFKLW